MLSPGSAQNAVSVRGNGGALRGFSSGHGPVHREGGRSFAMSVSEPESWARLRLAQGESTTMSLELTGALGHMTLTIGQSPGCDWIVRESGVAPVHFSLHWDGSVLRIADVYGAGGVLADGVSVGAQWRALNGRSRIDFGKASIVVESLRTRATAHSPSSLPPMPHEPKRPGARSTAPAALSTKVTLLGVAPMESGKTPAPSVRPAAPQEARRGGREAREEPQRSHKPTLMGISSYPPVAQVPAPEPSSAGDAQSVRPDAVGEASVSPASAGRGGMGGPTLLGIGTESAGGSRRPSAHAPSGHAAESGRGRDVQVIDVHGVEDRAKHYEARGPSRVRPDATPSELPQVNRELEAALRTRTATPTGRVPLADGRPETRTPASAQSLETSGGQGRATERELKVPAEASRRQVQYRGDGVPQAVLISPDSDSPTGHPPADPGSSSWPPDARVPSEAPAGRTSSSFPSGRPPGLLESVPPKQRFPWHYVGVGLLTLVAYFAWLYLLDHL